MCESSVQQKIVFVRQHGPYLLRTSHISRRRGSCKLFRERGHVDQDRDRRLGCKSADCARRPSRENQRCICHNPPVFPYRNARRELGFRSYTCNHVTCLPFSYRPCRSCNTPADKFRRTLPRAFDKTQAVRECRSDSCKQMRGRTGMYIPEYKHSTPFSHGTPGNRNRY